MTTQQIPIEIPSEIFEIIKSYLLRPKDIYMVWHDIREHLNLASITILVDILACIFGITTMSYAGKVRAIRTLSKNSLIQINDRRLMLFKIIILHLSVKTPSTLRHMCRKMANFFTKSICYWKNEKCIYNQYNWVTEFNIGDDVYCNPYPSHQIHYIPCEIPTPFCVKCKIINKSYNTLIVHPYMFTTLNSFSFFENGIRYFSLSLQWTSDLVDSLEFNGSIKSNDIHRGLCEHRRNGYINEVLPYI